MDKKRSIINEKDLLILRKLLEDGRMSSASISKEIDLGREIVNYRIKRLIKENLIVKFIPKLNEEAMQYQEFIILLKLNLDDEISKEKFIRESMGNKYLIWTVKSESGWDLIIRLYALSISEFKEKLNEILENYSSILANYYTIISSEEIKENEMEVISRNLFEEGVSGVDFSTIKKGSLPQIDNKDREILNLLENDARVQYKEIADKLDISSDTVKYRIDKMKEQGIIEKFEPVINLNKIGLFQYAAIIKYTYLDREHEDKINEYLISNSKIVRAIKSLNSEEFFMTLAFTKEDDTDNFKEELKYKFGDKIVSVDMFKIE